MRPGFFISANHAASAISQEDFQQMSLDIGTKNPTGQLSNGAGAELIAGSARQDLTKKISVCIDKAERATKRAEDFYITAGQHIQTVKGLWPDHWLEIIEQDCKVGRTRAYEIMAIADGRTTVEETREKTNERSRRHDAKVKASVGNGSCRSRPRRRSKRPSTQPSRQKRKHLPPLMSLPPGSAGTSRPSMIIPPN